MNDLAFRIDLESTMVLAEGMYQQISTPEVVEKLPNKIRVILGLPEREEPLNETMEIVEGGSTNGEVATSSQSSPHHLSPRPGSSCGTGDTTRRSRDSSMERQYDMGNQFM